MNKQELIEYGKKVFNFHPDEKLETATQILDVAKKNMGSHEHYLHGATCFAEALARFADSEKR